MIISVVLFLSLIQIVFMFGGKMFLGELIVLLFLLLMVFVVLAAKLVGASWSNGGLFLMYGLNLANFIFIWLVDKRIVTGTIIIAVIGFLIAMFSYNRKNQDDDFDSDFEEIEPIQSEVTTSFEPGKYVASKTGKKFHAPKCDWAKRIKKSSQVWFNEKDEAKDKGYKACDCVK